MASPANPKMNAAWLNTLRRNLENLNDLTAGESFFLLGQAHTYALTRQAEPNKDGTAIIGQSAHGFAAVGKCCEGNFVFHKIKRTATQRLRRLYVLNSIS